MTDAAILMRALTLPLALLLASCGGDDYQQPVNGWELVESVQGKDVQALREIR